MSTAALVEAFIETATAAFAPLVESPAGTWSVRVEQVIEGRIVEASPENVSGLFFVTGAFANSSVRGQISFGDLDLGIAIVVGPAAGSGQYGLWEWADASDQPEAVPRGAGLVTTVDRMQQIVAGMANAVRALEPLIASPSAGIIDRMEAARARALAEHQAELREDRHRAAAAQAAVASRARDLS